MNSVLYFNEYIAQQQILGIFNEAQINIFTSEMSTFNSLLNENSIYSIHEGLGEKLKKLKDIVAKFFEGLIKRIKEFFGGLIQKIKDLFKKTKIKDNKIVHEAMIDSTLRKAIDYFKYYDGTEIAFGEFPYGNPIDYFHKNSQNCFRVFKSKAYDLGTDIAMYYKRNTAKENKELIKKIKDENERVKTNCIHYMLSDGSKTDESHFSQDLINHYIGSNGKLKFQTITTNNIDRVIMGDIYDAAFEGRKWLQYIDRSYKEFLEDINKYKEEAETVCESEDSPVLTAFLSYITTVTNLGLSVIRAGNQINNHWRVKATEICRKVLSEYTKLSKGIND